MRSFHARFFKYDSASGDVYLFVVRPQPFLFIGLGRRTSPGQRRYYSSLITEFTMPAPPKGLRPMKDFDPSQPAVLHDVLNDCMVPWDWEKNADDFKQNALYQDDGLVAWDGQVFDGWGNVLGG